MTNEVYTARLKTAENEAKRFLKKVNELKEFGHYNSRANASVKRASMDLTNALADLRKSPW